MGRLLYLVLAAIPAIVFVAGLPGIAVTSVFADEAGFTSDDIYGGHKGGGNNRGRLFDSSPFGSQDGLLADLTGSIFNSLHARLGTVGGYRTNGFAGLQQNALLASATAPDKIPSFNSAEFSSPASGVWLQGIQTSLDYDFTTSSIGIENQFAGLIAGVDSWLTPGILSGAFGGYIQAGMQTGPAFQETDVESYFGGIYASYRQDSWVANFMLTAGHSDHESQRLFVNPVTSGGSEFTSGNFDGTFVSPEVSLAASMQIAGTTIEPSARIRYAHMWLDRYSESGTVGKMSFNKRDASLVLGRAQIAVPFLSNFIPRVGIEAWMINNDKVSASLFGHSVALDAGGNDNQVTFFAGATMHGKLWQNISGFADGEFHVTPDGSSHAMARAGLAIQF